MEHYAVAGFYTLYQKCKGKSNSFDEMLKSQHYRYKAFSSMCMNMSYTAPQITARKHIGMVNSIFYTIFFEIILMK